MKLDCIIAIHNLIDQILQRFDLADITPRMDDLDELENLSGEHADLVSDLKLCLIAIRSEICSIEDKGFKLKSITKGTVTWSDNGIEHEWCFFNGKLSSQSLEMA